MKKSKFFISAIYTSPPTTMGGNTKIMLEMIDRLSDEYEFYIFTTEPKTFRKNLKNIKRVKIIEVAYSFKKFDYLSHYKEVKYIENLYFKYFKHNTISENDYFYSCIDFAPDVLPIYKLKEKYKFKWIASLYLFIPNPLENLLNNYKFPFLKYIIYFLYQKYVFRLILKRANLVAITNDYDRNRFPKNFQNKLFAFYGGVDIDEIRKASNKIKINNKIYDAVFCGRLHPQKGVSQLLEIWFTVVKQIPKAKLAVIGNGEKKYENFLKQKAKKLNIDKNIYWLGYVNGVNKYSIYLNSEIFVHPTIYDNNGMVAAEALCTGLPVIMYNLPQLRDIYKDGCIKIKFGNKGEYAQAIISELEKHEIVGPKDRDNLIRYWSWRNRIMNFNAFLKQHGEN